MLLKYIGKCQAGEGNPKHGYTYNAEIIVEKDGFIVRYIDKTDTVNCKHPSMEEVNRYWQVMSNDVSTVTTNMKLVRDKIPEIIVSSGDYPLCMRISDSEMIVAQLEQKLSEEVQEYFKDHSVEELVDIYEIICAILYHNKIPYNEFDKLLLSKRNERGGFMNGTYLKYTVSFNNDTHLDNSDNKDEVELDV